MKIQCDVCDKDEATFFCVADEAALCASCDHRVHHANKLAGKHHRFSLHHPPPPQQGPPLCDICKERRAFLFCQQDRAILCRDCDAHIHKANEHTLKHTRYLLTGVRISSVSTLYPSSSAAASAATLTNNSVLKAKPPLLVNKTPSTTSKKSSTTVQSCGSSPLESCDMIINNNDPQQMIINGAGNSFGEDLITKSSSSISEYLIEMLPGWHVEDFLDSSSLSPYGSSKGGDNDLLSIWDADLECNVNAFPSEKMGIWVPQAAPPPPPPPLHQTQNDQSYQQSTDLAFGGIKEQSKEFSAKNNIKPSRKRIDDSSFLVPQIGPPFNASKRSRTFW